MPFAESWADVISLVALCLPLTWIAFSRQLETLVRRIASYCVDLAFVAWNLRSVVALLKTEICQSPASGTTLLKNRNRGTGVLKKSNSFEASGDEASILKNQFASGRSIVAALL
jgi:hypothetical protein